MLTDSLSQHLLPYCYYAKVLGASVIGGTEGGNFSSLLPGGLGSLIYQFAGSRIIAFVSLAEAMESCSEDTPSLKDAFAWLHNLSPDNIGTPESCSTADGDAASASDTLTKPPQTFGIATLGAGHMPHLPYSSILMT